MAEHPTFVVCQGKQSDRVHQTDGNKDVSSEMERKLCEAQICTKWFKLLYCTILYVFKLAVIKVEKEIILQVADFYSNSGAMPCNSCV